MTSRPRGGRISGAVLSLLLAAVPAVAEEDPGILALREEDAAGGRRELAGEVRLADINSVIEISLDKEALRERIAQRLGGPSDLSDLIATARTFNRLASKGLETLPALEDALAAWDETTADSTGIEDLSRVLGETAQAALDILDGARHQEAAARIDARFGQALEDRPRMGMVDQYRLLFEITAQVSQELRAGVDEELKKRGVFIQLGGWLRGTGEDRPVHLPGFDSYEPGERFVVERFNFALTQQQKDELAQAGKEAAEINAKGTQALLDLRGHADSAAATLTEALRGCLDDLDSGLDGLRRDPSLADLTEWADTARPLVRDFRGRLLLLRQRQDEAASSDQLLLAVNEDIQALARDATRLVEHLRGLDPLLGALAGNPAVAQAWTDFRDQVVSKCRDRIGKATDELLGPLGAMIGAARASRRIASNVLEFGDEVQRFDIESLPSRTSLDLVTTGRREPGDTLDLVLAAGRAERKEARQVLERRTVPLFRTLSYVALNVGVIMGDPEGELPSGRRFQAAPSYSILFKRDSRKSVLYNRLLNPGVGINLAAFDFDGDDTVELGAGAVVSVLSDFLQAGYGYNFGADRWYGFIGLRLPVGMKQIPLGRGGRE